MTGVITSLPPLIEQPPGNNSSNPAGLPGVTYVAAIPNLPQTWSALQTFLAGTLELAGTGGTSQVVKQTTLNGPVTVAQLTFSDISGSIGPIQLPTPTISTLGGVFSKAAISHNFLTQIGTDGSITQAQPAFTDISGSIAPAQIPNPSPSTLGGVQSAAPVSHQWINSISTSGVPALSQPAFTDISGSVAATQLPNPSATTLGGIESAAAVSHQWINSISTSGVPALSQPAFTDISGQATLAQLPTLGASTVLGSVAGGTPIALTTTQHTALVNAFTTTLNGSVPNPGTIASKFLRDDGTWQAVAGAGTVTNVATAGLATGGPITASGTVTVTAVAKSDQTAGTSNVLAVTPLHQQDHDSAVKAWGQFTQSAGTYTNATSYNVASFTKVSTGIITINLTTAFASTAYVVVFAANQSTSATIQENFGSRSASSFQVIIQTTGSGAVVQDIGFSFTAMGRQ